MDGGGDFEVISFLFLFVWRGCVHCLMDPKNAYLAFVGICGLCF